MERAESILQPLAFVIQYGEVRVPCPIPRTHRSTLCSRPPGHPCGSSEDWTETGTREAILGRAVSTGIEPATLGDF